MDSVLLLSEIHPRGVPIYDPLQQAHEWFDLLSDEDIQRVKSDPPGFVETIALIHERASERHQMLVIRDWSHLDFTGVPLLPNPSYKLATAEVLRPHFDVIQTATVRHPVDQWLSLNRMRTVRGRITLSAFLRGYLAFAEKCQSIGFVQYEDFAQSPNCSLRSLCENLALPFDPSYVDRWAAYDTITTDPELRSDSTVIQPPQRRPVSSAFSAQFEQNPDYWKALLLLEYDHVR